MLGKIRFFLKNVDFRPVIIDRAADVHPAGALDLDIAGLQAPIMCR